MYTSRSSHVRYDAVVRSIDIEPRNRRNAVGVDVEGAHRVHDRLQHRVVGTPGVEIGEEPVAEVGERAGALLGRHVAAVL